ncbi:hypothetical protein ABT071_21670 [Streptomyces sp. NPDC002506]|uniref:hypothetical protein n=1 Tax=Streptomyces sp. NPDC002506 TaxID=3154536 RepID=UPI0033319907
MTQTNKHAADNDSGRGRVTRRVRTWFRAHRHNLERDFLRGAANELGSTTILVLGIWLGARR